MDELQVEQRGAVTWLWLNRPEKLNALNPPLLTALRETFAALAVDDSVRAIVLAGRGRAFCAGFDIEWMSQRTVDSLRADRAELRQIFAEIERCPKPLISAVHGDAMGGGLILTLVSDIVLASDTARFGVPEVNIGVFPSLRLIPRLERIVGLRAAQNMALTGEPVDSATALRMGLVTQLVSDDSLVQETERLAERLAALPATAVQAIKASFAVHHLPDYDDWETDMAVECWAQPERVAAMAVFLRRRK